MLYKFRGGSLSSSCPDLMCLCVTEVGQVVLLHAGALLASLTSHIGNLHIGWIGCEYQFSPPEPRAPSPELTFKVNFFTDVTVKTAFSVKLCSDIILHSGAPTHNVKVGWKRALNSSHRFNSFLIGHL